MKILEYLFVSIVGAMGYGGIEMLWRGKTHWSMLLLGGICFLCIYCITVHTAQPLPVKWLLCAVCVTGLELLCGVIVNLRLGWAVWDYSDIKGNLMGQVCPKYALYWFLLSVPCSLLSAAMKRCLFGRSYRQKGQ